MGWYRQFRDVTNNSGPYQFYNKIEARQKGPALFQVHPNLKDQL